MSSANDKGRAILQGVFGIAAALYIVSMPWAPFLAHWLVKALPALSLALLVKLCLRGRQSLLLIAALIFSAGGDVALSIRAEEEQTYFVLGLGLFLVAHLCYVVAFAMHRKYQQRRLPVMVAFGTLAIAMTVILLPHLGGMRVPVLFYIAAITAMGFAATLNTQGGVLLIVGAALFFLSDAIIAINTFLFAEPHPLASYVIMPTYYAAQYCIAMAFVKKQGSGV